MKEYRKTITGIIVTIFLLAMGILAFYKSNQSYSVQEAEQTMQSKDSEQVRKMPIEAKVQKIREVPWYGWATYVGHGMVILNFSKPEYKKGQTIVFYITGCQTNEEAYLVNANVKY